MEHVVVQNVVDIGPARDDNDGEIFGIGAGYREEKCSFIKSLC
jgi:hypothetical protein